MLWSGFICSDLCMFNLSTAWKKVWGLHQIDSTGYGGYSGSCLQIRIQHVSLSLL
jgi:hypothetical protein